MLGLEVRIHVVSNRQKQGYSQIEYMRAFAVVSIIDSCCLVGREATKVSDSVQKVRGSYPVS